MRRSLPALLLVGALGAAATSVSLPRADVTRHARSIDQALLFVPEPGQVRAASMGFAEPLASLFWVRTVLRFGERFGRDESPEWNAWLRRMIEAVYTLDPKWRTAYYYGGTILRAMGDVDGSDQVFTAARANLPQDWFFPFSLGMNAYLYRDDPRTAAALLAEAAVLPDAPGWYGAAAAAMKQEYGDRAAGIRYLEELLESQQDPGMRADTERQLARLRHNELVDQWAEACKRRRAAGGSLAAPEALADLGFALPANPRGDAWVVGRDGVVRSEGAEAERYREALQAEWKLIHR